MTKTSPPLRHLYEPAAYDTARWPESYWRATTPPPPETPPLGDDTRADVAIVGAGYAGLNAARVLAGQHGMDVVVLDAGRIGWGASGRNGGFCCMGGTKLPAKQMIRLYGLDATKAFDATQVASTEHVARLFEDEGIAADKGPLGEICVAHSDKAWQSLQTEAAFEREIFGRDNALYSQAELAEQGVSAHWVRGGLKTPVGFPIHPMKYVQGLGHATLRTGARVYGDSPVSQITRDNGAWIVETPAGSVRAPRLMIATNGYGADNLPEELTARRLPVLSTILVTRPLSEAEQAAQGWTTRNMVYDSRTLLHYVRMLPDGRFMFGMRGGIKASDKALAAIRATARKHFEAMYPAWAHAETEFSWSGLVCLTGSLTPFAGAIDDETGLYAAFGWHGNGVALSSYSGAQLGHMIAGANHAIPALMQTLPRRFPFPALRRVGLAASYAAVSLADGRIGV